jgi:hypothetical protein
MSAPRYATTDELDAALAASEKLIGYVAEFRDTLAALEQRMQALEQNAAMLADIGDAFERAGQRLTAATAPLIVSDEAFDELQTMIKQDQETHAPARAAAPAASDDAWQEFLQELHSLQERALREGIGPRCDMVEWARLLWNGAPAAEPAPAPAGSLVEVVAALIANGIACDREEERIAADVIAAVAEWLERHHTGRIANGSQFADLLREALEREAGR